MEKEFVPYEEALALKGLGFKMECISFCWDDGMIYKGFTKPFNHNKSDYISRPLYQQAFRFLLPLIEHKTIDNYVFRIILIKKNGNFLLQRKYYTQGNSFENYSDGTNEDCLRKLIEIVK